MVIKIAEKFNFGKTGKKSIDVKNYNNYASFTVDNFLPVVVALKGIGSSDPLNYGTEYNLVKTYDKDKNHNGSRAMFNLCS